MLNAPLCIGNRYEKYFCVRILFFLYAYGICACLYVHVRVEWVQVPVCRLMLGVVLNLSFYCVSSSFTFIYWFSPSSPSLHTYAVFMWREIGEQLIGDSLYVLATFSVVVIEKSNLGRRGFIPAYNSQVTVRHWGKSGQELEAGTEAEAIKVCSLRGGSSYFYLQLKNSTAHSGLGSPTPINNERTQRHAHRPTDRSCYSSDVPSYQVYHDNQDCHHTTIITTLKDQGKEDYKQANTYIHKYLFLKKF